MKDKELLPKVPKLLRFKEEHIVWDAEKIPALVVNLPDCDKFELVMFDFISMRWATRSSSDNKAELIKQGEEELSAFISMVNAAETGLLDVEDILSKIKAEA